MKLLLSQGAENLAPLQYPTLHPMFASVAKRCSTWLPAWLAGRDQQQPQAHTDPGKTAPVMALLAATLHYCHGTKPFTELERSRLQTLVCAGSFLKKTATLVFWNSYLTSEVTGEHIYKKHVDLGAMRCGPRSRWWEPHP